MDLHHNLFYSYRGPSKDKSEDERDQQLENNLTKALVNTLRLGGDVVWRPFLSRLGIRDANDASFLLQRHDLPSGRAAQRRRRVLLGISKTESKWSSKAHAVAEPKGLPDAWIYGDGFAVLVESKVTGDFSPPQMQSHLARLQSSENAAPQIVLMTWAEIHTFFHGLLSNLSQPASLLAQQFVEYLEYTGMTGFTGFRRDHFEYFLTHDDDDARRWVRAQLEDFAGQVRERLREFSSFYGTCDIGTLRLAQSAAWAAFGPSNYREVTHQTMSLASDGLRVFVNAELKSATHRIKAVLKQAADAVRETLRELHAYEPFDLVLEERIQRQASIYDCIPKIRVHSSLLADEVVGRVAWMAFVETLQHIPLPYLHLDRLVPPNKLLKLSEHGPAEAVELVTEVFRRNHAVVELLNG